MTPRLRWILPVVGLCIGGAGLPARGADDVMANADRAYRRGDLSEAIRLYRDEAGKGNAVAQARLGDVLDKAEENEEAVQWYRRSAEQGHPDGLHGLGQMHAMGEGVPRSHTTAIRYWSEASQRGHVVATLALARTYETGWADVKADAATALGYWRKAAELGDASAIERLAQIYRKGDLGVKPDESQALAWEARLPARKKP